MIPGRPVFYPQPPQRDFDGEEKDLRADIALNERLVDSLLRILPAFVTESGVQRMGNEGITILLLNFRNTLRDWMCLGLEQNLADLQVHRANPAPMYRQPKPTPEQWATAQINVQRMEEAVEAMNNLADKEAHAFAGPIALMRPMIEIQLDAAWQHLEYIRSAMEEPEVDGSQTPEVSNEPASGEAIESE
jgi:hypothetical protein